MVLTIVELSISSRINVGIIFEGEQILLEIYVIETMNVPDSSRSRFS